MVKAYIITPNYNGLEFLDRFFKSIFEQSYRNFKIVFVDNSPNDDSIRHIKKNYPGELGRLVIIKNPENYGFTKANNIGINVALKDKECEYVICLNNDTEVKPDFLEELITSAKKHPYAGSIQAKLIWSQNIKLIDSVGLEYSKNGLGFNRGAFKLVDTYEDEEEIFGCCAGACLYRRAALEDIKVDNDFFDGDFFAYYEDVDLAIRLRWAGWTAWFSPKSIVYHYKGGTTGNKTDFTVYYTWRNYTWTLYKNLPCRYILKNSYLIIACEISQIIVNLLRKKPIIIRSKITAYKNLRIFVKKKKTIKKKVEFKEIEKWFILKWREETPKNP
jgi:GT2 family glycosyltransferase